MIKTIILIILILLFIFLFKKKNIENFHNLLDPRYHTISYHNERNLYSRFLDYFHYGNINPHTLPTVPLNIYNYPMNYIKSPMPIRTTMYEIQNIKNPYDYSYQVVDKNGNLHLLDYSANAKMLTNENFYENVWLNPHDRQIVFIPK
jgi:hypothetical protein